MLKIKRERLDELEKFGFERMKNLPRYCFYFGDAKLCLYVTMLDCEMWLNADLVGIPNVIYDLIEAGMVEKEGE